MPETSPMHARARAKRAVRPIKRPASFSPEGFERMREGAFGHLLKVIGLASIGGPRLNEPLAASIERVRHIVGGADGEAACLLAGCSAVREASSDIDAALDRLIAALPTWLLTFTLAPMDAYLWGFDWNATDYVPMSKSSVREALSVWPRLPVGACILKDQSS